MNPANSRPGEGAGILLLSELENIFRLLHEDPDADTCLDALDRIPILLEKLSHDPSDDRVVREQTSRLLNQIADALQLADARLRKAQLSVRTELHELSSQQEWVQASRQIT